MMMRILGVLAMLAVPMAMPALAGDARDAVVYKTPQCGCCEAYADYLADHGYQVRSVDHVDLDEIRREHGVPAEFAGCHITMVEGYVVEGHVPVAMIDRLLDERPQVRGISLPGMPVGSPGMPGPKTEPFVVYQFGDGESQVFAVE